MGCGASTDASIGKQSFNKRHASLKQIFESLDADGDGKVSLYELDAKLKADTEVQDLLEKRGRATRRRSAAYVASVLLKNKTNTANPIITFKDFKREVEKTELRDLFDLIDEDGDGTISKAELNAKLEQDYDIQEKLQAAHGSGYQFVFEQLDLNGDGVISWEEFATTLEPHLHDETAKQSFSSSSAAGSCEASPKRRGEGASFRRVRPEGESFKRVRPEGSSPARTKTDR